VGDGNDDPDELFDMGSSVGAVVGRLVEAVVGMDMDNRAAVADRQDIHQALEVQLEPKYSPGTQVRMSRKSTS
jgi:hypothetical protein